MAKLTAYRRKRNFQKTSEPAGNRHPTPHGNRFVVQKHDATRLHYDFRLEIGGVLVSWAVPKGPSMNPADKRLAMQTEDHPLEYIDFEGVIPENNYGAGPVEVWDNGTFDVEGNRAADEQLARGEIKFLLHGQKLHGSFVLVKMRRGRNHGKPWLMIKHRDSSANPHWDIDAHENSVLSGRSIREIEKGTPPGETPLPPESIDGARKATMPVHPSPTLATLAERPFSDPDWLFEIKWDGVRALARVDRKHLTLRSRRNRDITRVYPELADLPKRLRVNEAILDGEIVVLDESGRSDFGRLQSRMNVLEPSVVLIKNTPVTYFLFDILYCDGYDLRRAALLDRKALLREAIEFSPPFMYSDHQLEKGKELFQLASQKHLEGIIGKRIHSSYPGKRTTDWQKFKIVKELHAVIGGYTAPRRTREHFGALLLGLYRDGKLQFIGGMGTGFNRTSQQKIIKQLVALHTSHSPFEEPPRTQEESFWIKPKMVARVKYVNWTQEQRLRSPVFLALLPDHDPRECRFDTQTPAPEPACGKKADRKTRSRFHRSRNQSESSGTFIRESDIEQELFHGRRDNISIKLNGKPLQLTHLNKIYYPESGYTKRRLLAYYYRVAPLILPFLRDRPMILRRYPDGITGKAFFQKDSGHLAPSWMETVPIHSEEKNETIHYFLARDRASLLFLTNLGCIDHNPWFSRRDDLEHPDYFFFDLDPSEKTSFKTVVAVAGDIYRELTELGVRAFLKTSGATGIHIYVPIKRMYTYDQLRNFTEIVGRVATTQEAKVITRSRAVSRRKTGSILIDATQNSYARSLAAPYSLRAFPKAPVSCPIAPEELNGNLQPEQFNINSVLKRIETKGDPWKDFWKARQTLNAAIEKLDARLHKPT